MSAKNQALNLRVGFEDGVIIIDTKTYTIDEAKILVKNLQSVIKKNCNVATVSAPMVRSLFESVNNPDTLTIFIDSDEEYASIRAALKIEKDSLIAVLSALMEYYKEKEALNIIIKSYVLRNHGDVYRRYTAQFTQQVASKTQEFLKVKAVYDEREERLGIFCRKSEFDISVTFFGQLVDSMQKDREAFVLYSDLPDTYADYPSMLHFKLKKKLDNPDIRMHKLATGLRFYFPKP